ncbi:glycosyltransferase involved in cell wall biosynthesis [Diaminobutyricimonas aerilata]|uniref:Glycosyltransferase involved in cell wall biosynthesis n=1 Tax=Diaminobutyricimonas aerilata TaxID=1162967 RepID=A0A2M9CH45_9MICO|nr:glycosyltransferase family 2 protein [Diaminobutyricimonas aerilata]PJJ71234.1 glycosyltransferase involved in cell wall biosynthesis [Diaminobutyricimonas aerilata]
MTRVSVALATFNGARYLEEQLSSILVQTRLPDEIVVSDDGSTDETHELVERIRDEHPEVEWVIESGGGLGVVRNFDRAVRGTTGDVIVLSDQDDRWHDVRIERALAELERTGALLHHSDARLVDATGTDLGATLFERLEIADRTFGEIEQGDAFGVYLRRNLATGAATAFRRELLDDALPFPEAWVHDEWLAILAAARGRIAIDRAQLIDYRQHGANQIGVRRPTLARKVRRVFEHQGGRNEDLAVRARVLFDRLVEVGTPQRLTEAVAQKAAIEQRRADLPRGRVKRLPGVVHLLRTGAYERYASQGRKDALRDLLSRR